MITDIQNSIFLAKSGARKLSIIYIGVLALWVMVQNGIPMASYLDIEVDEPVWLQTLAGLGFVAALGWLLYLLIERGLRLIVEAQEALKLLVRAIESSVNAVLISDHQQPKRPIVYANPAFERITGYSRAEALGRNPLFLQGRDRDQPELEALVEAVRAERPSRAVLRSYRKDGSMYWTEVHVAPVRNETGSVAHYVTVLNDITETRSYQDELARQANYDSLTKLANRNLLSDRIAHALARCERHKAGVAICVIGLDKFRLINDGLGYPSGSELLGEVAARLQSRFRAVDTIARVGGDEFALVLVDQAIGPEIAGQIQRMLNVFTAPFQVQGQDLFVTASIGVALSPQDGADAETLLKRAEIAMHRAKEHEGNAFQMFTAEMDARVTERVSLENDLRRALERDEFVLYYQPRVDFASGRICGAEALIRWNHPQQGLMPPSRFIPLAEETGLVTPIGEWALRSACAQTRAWEQAGLAPITMAVNISARQFRQEGLASRIGVLLRETGLESRHLELELTESAVMHDAQEVIAILHELKAMGVKIAIDDFGTGYSSLSHLKRFPIDYLKIDQSFVRGVPRDADDAAIIMAIIAMARSLGLKLIAEGVETDEQRQFLYLAGCEECQGYFFSRPVPAEEFRTLLERKVPFPGKSQQPGEASILH
ncbi:MAG: EAL domain-containing protein [Betaproteobacteria bacterium]|nr:EAL domain-containing protein [Betaproteobacteria bacterium]